MPVWKRLSRMGFGALGSAALLGCAAPATPPDGTPTPVVQEPSAPPLRMGGRKVLLLPVQSRSGLPDSLDAAVDSLLLLALEARDPSVTWVDPGALERALRRTPGFAGSPRALPADRYRHHRERRIVDPLASTLRRYSALTDARWIVIPRAVSPAGGAIRISAVVVDAHAGTVLWWGEPAGEPAPGGLGAAFTSAASALASRMVAKP